MVFTDLPLTQEFKTLGMDDYLWVQALFNHEELERLRGQEPTNPHQHFLWRIIRMGVIDPEAADKAMDASTQSMRLSGNWTCCIMFFFELLFSYVPSQFSSMFPLLTYFQSFLSLSADHLRHSR